jgi:hypothetical protein
MGQFDHILNWKLKRGSHAFPGKDGGTCINEVAIVAAGFEYRSVRDVNEMPSCFSRPICALAMYLNDLADDNERQRLLPFVTRLACADTPEVERERAAYIKIRTSRYGSFDEALMALKGALRIGRQADDVPYDEVSKRMEAVRRPAKKPTRAAHLPPVFARLKSFFA